MKDERAKGLRGLVGIHSAHGDEDNCWWTIVPLQKPAPFVINEWDTYMENIPDWEARESLPACTPQQQQQQKQQQTAVPPPLPYRANYPYVVNTGTHHVPLFTGFPPEPMVYADDPFEWLLENLRKQQKPSEWSLQHLWSSVVGSSGISGGAGSARKALRKRRPSKMFMMEPSNRVVLSKGAGVVVRIGDPNLEKLAPVSIYQCPTKNFDQTVMHQILTAEATAISADGRPSLRSGRRVLCEKHSNIFH
jgi:hypothetical protein